MLIPTHRPPGFKGQPVCFLFTDAEVKDEAFLEYINQILMTGEVAGEARRRAAGTAARSWGCVPATQPDWRWRGAMNRWHLLTNKHKHKQLMLWHTKFFQTHTHTQPPGPGLFPKDELDMIINDIRPVFKAANPGTPDTWDNLYQFFLNRVRDNLHVILCFRCVRALARTHTHKHTHTHTHTHTLPARALVFKGAFC